MRSASVRPSVPPPGVRGRLKGTAVRAGLLWYAQTYGQGALARVADAASPALLSILRREDAAFGVIASGWYDLPCMGELLEHMERVADPEDAEVYVDRLAGAIAKDNVSGIYKSLFRLIVTPTLLQANAQRVWQTYIDEGTLTAKSPTKGQLVFEIRGWDHHHAAVCRVVGFMMQNVLREVGYTAMIVERTHCVATGDGECGFEGMYLP
jgi:hypothetical protein